MDYLDCPPPDCILVIERPAEEEPEPLVDLLAPLDDALAAVTAATGLGLEEQLSDEELAALERGRLLLPDFALSYLRAGDAQGRRVLFLHGSPGEAAEWGYFLKQVPPGLEFLAVDRPGFGESGPEEGLDSLQAQADALAPLLAVRPAGGTLLVGYSYGGPLALRLAVDHPDRVAGLLLIGAALDPSLEEVHPLQALAAATPLAQLLPRELANANAELLALGADLKALSGDLAQLALPVTLVQGGDDGLVPPENLAFAESWLTNARPLTFHLVEEGDHFLPWTHHETLRNALNALLEAVERRQAEGG